MFWQKHYKYYREHYKLSNGQRLGIYFKRTRFRVCFSPSENHTVWSVGLVIGDTRRQCNDWYECKKNRRQRKVYGKITGDVGLEGLRIGFNFIKRLIDKIDYGDFIVIRWEDKKRQKTYEFLKRLGFVYGEYDEEEVLFYHKEVPNKI